MKQKSYQWSEQGIVTQLDVAMNQIGKMMSDNPAMSESDRAFHQGQALDALSEVVKSTVHLMAMVARGRHSAGLLIDMPIGAGEDDE